MIEQGEIIRTPLADMYIETVLKCPAVYKLKFSAGYFNFDETYKCYERGGHINAHKTCLNDFSETGAIITWNNPKDSETLWKRQIRGK